MSDIICPTCGTNGQDCFRKDCQMVADRLAEQLAPWTGREVFASMADAGRVTAVGIQPVNPLQSQLDAANARIVELDADVERLTQAYRNGVMRVGQEMHEGILKILARMAIDDAPKPLDPGAGAVAGRVDGVIQDALAGRLTKGQKAGVRSAIDRSDRVSPSSDQAVGKAIGG